MCKYLPDSWIKISEKEKENSEKEMVLRSVFEEPNTEFYNLNLDNVSQSDILETKVVDINTPDYSIKSNINYGRDLCIIHTKRYNKKSLVEHVNIQGPYVMIAYLISGALDIKRKSKERHLKHDKLRIGGASSTKNRVEIPAHCKTESILVYIRASYFLKLLENEEWIKNHALYHAIINKTTDKPNLASIYMTPKLQDIFLSITNLEDAKNINRHLIGIRIKELFLQIHSTENKKEQPIIDTERVAKIEQAKAYITKNFTSTPTIKELSKLVYLNEMQLKQDFKKMYGTTIRGYIIELKMKKAMELLKHYQVTEISNMMGYQSVSHFITTFKKHHGLNPSQIKKTTK